MKIKLMVCNGKMRLRTVDKKDMEFCRNMKNKNTCHFFYKEKITPQMQLKWYNEYIMRKNDYIFVIEEKLPILPLYIRTGCIGCRVIANYIDLYNMMVVGNWDKKMIMRNALTLLDNYIIKSCFPDKPVSIRVEKNNYDEYKWFINNGFEKKEEIIDGELNPYYLLVEKSK